MSHTIRHARLAIVALLTACLLAACAAAETPSPTITARPLPTDTEIPFPTTPTQTLTYLTPGEHTPGPTPSLSPTPSPTPYPFDIPDLQVVYGRGIRPAEAVARLGMGYRTASELSPDGRYWAIGTTVGIYVYDTRTMNQLWAVAVRSPVEQIEWSPDSQYVAVRLSQWGNILIWEASSGALVHRLEHEGDIVSMEWSPDGRRIASSFGLLLLSEGEYRSGFTLWDFGSGTQLGSYQTSSDDPDLPNYYSTASDVSWLPDIRHLIVATSSSILGLYDSETGALLRSFERPQSSHSTVRLLKISPDATKVISYSGLFSSDAPGGDETAYVWDIATGDLLFSLPHDGEFVGTVRWSPDSQMIVTSSICFCYPQIRLAIWDGQSGQLLNYQYGSPSNDVNPFWQPDGQSFITDGTDGQLLLWSRVQADYVSQGYDFSDLASYVSNSFLTQAPWSGPIVYDEPERTGTLVWSTSTGRPEYRFVYPIGGGSLVWSPDGNRLAVLPRIGRFGYYHEDTDVYVWEPITAHIDEQSYRVQDIRDWGVPDLSDDDLWLCNADSLPAAWSTDGHAAYVELDPIDGDKRNDFMAHITIRRINGAVVIHELEEVGSNICNVAFSPDNRLLAVGHESPWGDWHDPSVDQNYVTIWDIETETLLHTFYGHTETVYALAWSPDGNYLASSSYDGTTLIWDINRAGDE